MNVERVVEAERDLAHFRFRENSLSIWIVAIHNSDRIAMRAPGKNLGEQPQLGGEIILDASVIVEMIASEVGEKARAEIQRIDTALGDTDRGNFGERVA